MREEPASDLEQAFHQRLLEAIEELRKYTRAGVRDTLERIQRDGGLKTARQTLNVLEGDRPWVRITQQPGQLFWAAERAGRIDLSIEAIVLDLRWAPLFTQTELDTAGRRLRSGGESIPLEQAVPPQSALAHRAFSELSLGRPLYFFDRFDDDCQRTEAMAAAVDTGLRPIASLSVRRHLRDCNHCQAHHSELVRAYERFDQEAIQLWANLLKSFEVAMHFTDADLKQFFLNEREDFQDPGDYEAALDFEMERVRDHYVWRAVRLGSHIGRFMSTFPSTFYESDLWLKWRRGEVSGLASDLVRGISETLFALGLTAQNLRTIRDWAEENEDVLFLPSFADLTSIPGILHADEVADLDEWVEVLGPPPENLNLLGTLYISYQAALAHRGPAVPAVALRDKADSAVSDQFEELKASLESRFDSMASSLEDIRFRQEAAIFSLERMVAYMSSTDRFACEESLIRQLGDVYGKLKPEARCHLVAAEQIYRVPSIAAPGVALSAFSAAFEVEMRMSLMTGLFEYLKYKKTGTLHTPIDWPDSDRTRPIYKFGMKAESLTFGEMERLLRHPEAAIAEYVGMVGLDCGEIRSAVLAVSAHRNPAVHVKRLFDVGTAEAIRNDWLQWHGRRGGIFGVLFRTSD